MIKFEGKSISELEQLAKQGNADAQYNLGGMYFAGKGVLHNLIIAAKWFKLAAEQGHADAQFNLGVMYYNGKGVTQDYEATIKWFLRAAHQGHAQAQQLISSQTRSK